MKVKLARPAVIIGIALGAVVVLGLAAVLVGSLAHPSASRTATGPVDGVRTATFQLMDGATSVRLAAGALGDDLYRVSVPAGAGIRPEVDRDGGDVRLRLVPAPGGGSGIVNIVVNEKVSWALRTLGGAREIRIDMTGGSPSEIQLAGGASLIDLALSRPSASLPVTMSGGVDQFAVRLPSGTPVRVTAASGAGTVTVDGQVHQGVAGGQSFTANGWRDGGPGVDVRAQAGAGIVRVSAA
ncbi:hypothetical protein [Actinoplanes subtropicus]|uniref:hypothetical protein n=1 Tax=Actinoplanes subtropicus TaxID=543632 RepID=UPI000691A126|nr:hypothetical protein [Actinoplanes subtropicus]